MHKRVLIFNEDIEELSGLRQLLVKEGCEVITATNWETAKKLFSGIPIDYVLLDTRHEAIQTMLNSGIHRTK